MWILLGVEHSKSNSNGEESQDGTSDNDSDSPVRQQRNDVDNSLLVSVGEVVVSGVHVMVGSGVIHLNQTSVEIWRSSIQFSAVSLIVFSISCIVTVGSQ